MYYDGRRFHELKSQLADFIYYSGGPSFDELEELIDEAYRNDDISGTQYDNLMGMLRELPM